MKARELDADELRARGLLEDGNTVRAPSTVAAAAELVRAVGDRSPAQLAIGGVFRGAP